MSKKETEGNKVRGDGLGWGGVEGERQMEGGKGGWKVDGRGRARGGVLGLLEIRPWLVDLVGSGQEGKGRKG